MFSLTGSDKCLLQYLSLGVRLFRHRTLKDYVLGKALEHSVHRIVYYPLSVVLCTSVVIVQLSIFLTIAEKFIQSIFKRFPRTSCVFVVYVPQSRSSMKQEINVGWLYQVIL
ncbi:hypothetical protein NPIL_432641 [Nephila pilipes]|uniref:Uncharacterized protein n=1 Tax=Nephila pilipes TaxID=299642 RepID=A0A8X6NEW9_NEPPI|nr:hypothetical protein NPIL_432641 [Nephila pilipes]